MIEPSTIQNLNRLLAIVGRSFPQYLQYSRPYVPPGRDELIEALQSIVADQNAICERISQILLDAHAPLRTGEFPMDYTDKHDLDIDYLVGVAVEFQEQDIASIGQLVEQLQTAPAAKALAEEALGMAKGHLDSLREMIAEVSKK